MCARCEYEEMGVAAEVAAFESASRSARSGVTAERAAFLMNMACAHAIVPEANCAASAAEERGAKAIAESVAGLRQITSSFHDPSFALGVALGIKLGLVQGSHVMDLAQARAVLAIIKGARSDKAGVHGERTDPDGQGRPRT